VIFLYYHINSQCDISKGLDFCNHTMSKCDITKVTMILVVWFIYWLVRNWIHESWDKYRMVLMTWMGCQTRTKHKLPRGNPIRTPPVSVTCRRSSDVCSRVLRSNFRLLSPSIFCSSIFFHPCFFHLAFFIQIDYFFRLVSTSPSMAVVQLP